MSIGSFDSRTPDESYPLSFNVAALLGAAETVASAVFSAEVDSGVDAAVASRLVGPVAVDGAIVSQRWTGGVANTTYLLSAVVTTSAGNTFEVCGFVHVEAC